MSLNLKIIKNYSQALYSESMKSNILDEVMKNIVSLEQIIKSSIKIEQLLCSPVIEGKIKDKIITMLESRLGLTQLVANFLRILVKNSRFFLISEIVENFSQIVANNKNIQHAKIYSAYALAKNEIDLIISFLESRLKKQISLETNIDESLIGGAVIQYDSNLIDCSVKGALDRIKKVATSSRI
jgi:F-type H+-transporting ATPase subunit delta